MAVAAGLVCMHAAAVWGAVAILRFAAAWWRVRSSGAEEVGLVAAWTLPAAVWLWWPGDVAGAYPAWVLLPPALLAAALGWGATRLLRWRRHSSQAATLLAMFLGFALPAVTFHPAAADQADKTRRQVVETQLAPQAIRQRDEVQAARQAGHESGRRRARPDRPGRGRRRLRPAGQVPTESAFLVWSQTDLAAYRLTSAIELYGEDGAIVSRFALNLPEYTQAQQRWQEASCEWELFEEVSPFGSEERRLLHAGRGLCVERGGRRRGGRHDRHPRDARLRRPALHLVAEPVRRALPEPARLRRRALAGVATSSSWSTAGACTPIYTSGPTAWTLDDETFRRVYASRTPFWTTASTRRRRRRCLPRRTIAAGSTRSATRRSRRSGTWSTSRSWSRSPARLFVLLTLLRSAGMAAAGIRGERGRDLLREIRASFYRKLFLAFVAVARHPGPHAGLRGPGLHDGPAARRHRGGRHPHHDGRAAGRRGLRAGSRSAAKAAAITLSDDIDGRHQRA